MSINMSSSSWAPAGESAVDLYTERVQLDASQVAGIAYGVFLCVWFTCVYYQVKGKALRQLPFGILAYLGTLFVLVMLYYVADTRWVQQMFIDDRGFHLPEGTDGADVVENQGPLGFFYNVYNTPMIVLGNSAYAAVNFFADALVLYRCYLIWNFNHLVMAFPTLIFLASTAMSVLTVWNNSISVAQFSGATATDFVLSWTILSLCLNVILTGMIVGRLLAARNRLIHVLGRQHARLYTSIAAMVIESAAITAIFALLFIVFFKIPGPVGQFYNFILPLLTYAAAISPTLILLRVARGRAYGRDTAVASSTGMHVSGKTTPMVTMNASHKSSATNISEAGVWPQNVEKHHESVTSYV